MKWGKKRWAALACGLLVWGHHVWAQEVGPRAGLGNPGPGSGALISVPNPIIEAPPLFVQEPGKDKEPTGKDKEATGKDKEGKDKEPGKDKDSKDIPVTPRPTGEAYNKLVPREPPDQRPYETGKAFPKRLFRLEPERRLFDRILADKLPAEPPAEKYPRPQPLLPHAWPIMTTFAEPSYLCHGRLFFEQRNFERYGWDLGVIQPPLESLIFYGDILALPAYWALDPCRNFECSTGLCLPGDPTPLLLNWLRVK
ncbi:MAG: hypothetical protein U0793_15115 [Gemmataceae bacterium]